ncbi:hypothetical protein D3C84_654040 [compost metagenome]
MAMAMSKPTANGIEPSPACAHSAARSALANRFQVSQIHAASSSQIPHLRSTLRTKVNGPLTASNVASAPKNNVHSSGFDHRLPSLNARAPNRLAASRMTMISNEPQPISCNRFNSAGRLAPRVPRLSLSAAIDDRPVSLPITPTAASSNTPTSVPRKIASNEPDRPRPGASKAPVCSTIRPMPRENHRENRSRPPKTRLSVGTAMSGE